MRQIILNDDDTITTNNEMHIFNTSDLISRESYKSIQKIIQRQGTIQSKVQQIMEIKSKGNTLIKEIDEEKFLSDFFSYDGGIKLSLKDLEEISSSLYLCDENGGKTKIGVDLNNPYIETLYNDFCYFRGENICFRNHKYYFLFDSLKIDDVGITTSINDYTITDIDFKAFKKDISTQYNRIDQHLKLFLDFIGGMTISNIIDRFDEFKNDIFTICEKEKIEKLKEFVKESKFSPNEDFNKKIAIQNGELVQLIEQLVTLIENISIKKSVYNKNEFFHAIKHIIDFFTIHGQGFYQIKNIFNIDINEILRKYIYNEIGTSHKKIILGLIDEKINILACMQNITQILNCPLKSRVEIKK